MAMGARMVMRTEALLTLVQWFSPGFPVGAFGYSHGLEWEIESGAVTDAEAVQSWIAEALPFHRKPRRARVARESVGLNRGGYGCSRDCGDYWPLAR